MSHHNANVRFFVYRREDGIVFFFSDEVREFLRFNSVLDNVRFSIAGAFPENRRPESLIGSWWTLPGEIRAYILFAALAVLGIAPSQYSRFRELRRLAFTGLLALLIIFSYVDHAAMPIIMDHPSYASPTRYFLLGAIMFYLRQHIPLTMGLCAAFLALPFLAYNNGTVFLFILMFSTCYTVFFIGYGIKNFGIEDKIGDWSFGIYIYGWFVQQIVASLDPTQSPYTNFIFAALFSVLLGWLSWRFVEAPSLVQARRWQPKDPRDFFSAPIRVRTHSQNMTAAASAQADKNRSAQRS